MACRVTRINYADLTDPVIDIEAVEDIFGMLETQVSAPPAKSAWVDPTLIDVKKNAADRLVEVPHYLAGGPMHL